MEIVLVMIGAVIVISIVLKITTICNENTDLKNRLSSYNSRYLETCKHLEQKEIDYNEITARADTLIREKQSLFEEFENRYLETCKRLEQKEKDYNVMKDRVNTLTMEKKSLLYSFENNLADRAKAHKWLAPLVADIKLVLKEKSRDSNERVTTERNYETMVRVDTLIREKKSLLEENTILKYQLDELENGLADREKAYKWLAPLVADIKLVLKEKSRDSNELITTKRSFETMARVDTIMREKKSLLEENAVLKYRLEYIKTLIPETDDIMEYDEYLNESLESDSPSKFLSKEEYNQLSDTEKNIKALEYYKQRKKRNWEIGRDFERYVGYKLELEHCEVEYFGIEMKHKDLGRDLIAKKDDITTIVQCKYWSKNKIIHEKHIAQLFGTVTKYRIDNPHEINVSGLFVSHTVLSEEAKRFADALGIQIIENMEMGEYPMIKCKNNSDKEYGFGTKIYHLPMDQQYDTAKINKKNGDFYAFTITEAENQGYRRAYKWHGN